MPDTPRDFWPEPEITCHVCEREGLRPSDMAIWRTSGTFKANMCMECASKEKEGEMPEVVHDVEIWCGRCGAGLCSQSEARRDGRGIDVEPCETCIEKEREAADDEGYERGKEDGG